MGGGGGSLTKLQNINCPFKGTNTRRRWLGLLRGPTSSRSYRTRRPLRSAEWLASRLAFSAGARCWSPLDCGTRSGESGSGKALTDRTESSGCCKLAVCESAAVAVAVGERGTVASAVGRAGDVPRGSAADGRSRSDVHRRRSSPGSSARNIWGIDGGGVNWNHVASIDGGYLKVTFGLDICSSMLIGL